MSATLPEIRTSDAERRRIQAVAWVVLLSALVIFILGAVGLPLLGLRYLRTATVAEKAVAEPRQGSLTLESVAGTRVLREGERSQVLFEGTTVSTYGQSSGFVRFFDGATLSLKSNVRVTVHRMRRPRFAAFAVDQVPRQIEIVAVTQSEAQAELVVGTTWGDNEFVVTIPGRGQVLLAPESHARLVFANDRLKVLTTDGHVTVRNADGAVIVPAGQRSEVSAVGPPLPPVDALENILVNGDFDEPPTEANGWTFERYPSSPLVLVPGRSRHQIVAGGRTVISFERLGSSGSSADMYYRQLLGDADVASSSFVGVSATVRVASQSLAGGGQATPPTEFPVILKLIFESGSIEYTWSVGLYAEPPEPDDPQAALLEEKHVRVPLGEWFEFDSGNLLDTDNRLGFAQRVPPLARPAHLRRFEVVASGHDYESQVDSAGVWVK